MLLWKNVNKTYLAITIVVLVILGVGGFLVISSSSSKKTQNAVGDVSRSTPSAMPSATAESVMAEENGEVTSLIVEASEMKFDKPVITIKAGQKISLKVKNIGQMPHDWVLEGTDIKTKMITKGSEETIEFSVEKPGEYIFFCSVGSHRKLGMEGKLIVK